LIHITSRWKAPLVNRRIFAAPPEIGNAQAPCRPRANGAEQQTVEVSGFRALDGGAFHHFSAEAPDGAEQGFVPAGRLGGTTWTVRWRITRR
jgi:hypothetical protein